MNPQIRVIALDLDGVLFDGPSAAYPIAEAVGIKDKFIAEFSRIQREGLSLEESVIQGSRIWKGIPTSGVYESIVHKLPLMTGAEETISTLRGWGYEVGCLSSGVSQFFMAPFLQRLNLNFAHSNVLGVENGKHNGEVEFHMGGPQKAERVKEYLTNSGYSTTNLASVGDGLNDIDMFAVSAISIAFNPKSNVVAQAATHTVDSKDLRVILKYFEP